MNEIDAYTADLIATDGSVRRRHHGVSVSQGPRGFHVLRFLAEVYDCALWFGAGF